MAAKPIPAGTTGADAVNNGLVKTKASPTRQAGQRPHRRVPAGRQDRHPGRPRGRDPHSDQFQQAQTRIGTLKIPDGKTALAVQLANVPGVAGFAGAGDHINVYGVVKADPDAGGPPAST